ncbi:helix-turn-helix domain-containing protein [Isoptericola sp. NPDC057391]|uniref:AraC family transcriptional regulator n=1 Tax=Isoptericola sp. NPDC057391 TaxID=3346117 RepID=UPI00363A1857
MSNIRHMPVAPTEVRHLATGDDVDLHQHEDHQLIYASTGVLEVTVEQGTWFTPSTRAAWIPGGTPHVWQVHGATTVRFVGVPLSLYPGSLYPSTEHDPALLLVSPLFRELVVACSENGAATTPAARRMLDVLVDQLRPAPQPATMVPALHDPRLREVQAIVEAELAGSPTLGELGRRVGASERTLSRLFRDTVGMSFTTWRNQVRLHRANHLLAEGRTVTQVAAACGFATPSAFVAVFRAAFGRTPGSMFR